MELPNNIIFNEDENEFFLKLPIKDKIESMNVYIENDSAEYFHLYNGCVFTAFSTHVKNVMYTKKPCPKCCSEAYIKYVLEPFKEAYKDFTK